MLAVVVTGSNLRWWWCFSFHPLAQILDLHLGNLQPHQTHTHTYTYTHTHRHAHTLSPFPFYTLSIKDVGQDLEKTMPLHSGRFGLVLDSSPYVSWSFAISCQLVIPTRSLLTMSIHRGKTPPGLLRFPCGLHLRSCFWGWWSGIRSTWPSLAVSCASVVPPQVVRLLPSGCPHSGACPTRSVLGCLEGISSERSSAF